MKQPISREVLERTLGRHWGILVSIFTTVAVAVLAFGGGYVAHGLMGGAPRPALPPTADGLTGGAPTSAISHWTCAMHFDVRLPGPGKCPK